jgi:DNA-binding response OmpR family regulator
MVVDDDDDVRALVRGAFEAQGWTVTEAPTGARALARLREPPGPDLVVLDLMMPGVSGFAVLGELRQYRHLRDLPIVVMAAKAGRLATRLAAALGADDCVLKPIDTTELRSRCGALLERARASG